MGNRASRIKRDDCVKRSGLTNSNWQWLFLTLQFGGLSTKNRHLSTSKWFPS